MAPGFVGNCGNNIVVPGENFVEQFSSADVDTYGDEPSAEEEGPSKPR